MTTFSPVSLFMALWLGASIGRVVAYVQPDASWNELVWGVVFVLVVGVTIASFWPSH